MEKKGAMAARMRERLEASVSTATPSTSNSVTPDSSVPSTSGSSTSVSLSTSGTAPSLSAPSSSVASLLQMMKKHQPDLMLKVRMKDLVTPAVKKNLTLRQCLMTGSQVYSYMIGR